MFLNSWILKEKQWDGWSIILWNVWNALIDISKNLFAKNKIYRYDTFSLLNLLSTICTKKQRLLEVNNPVIGIKFSSTYFLNYSDI